MLELLKKVCLGVVMFAGHQHTPLHWLCVRCRRSTGVPGNAGEQEPWRKRELASTLSDAWAALVGIGAAAFVGSVFAAFWLAEFFRGHGLASVLRRDFRDTLFGEVAQPRRQVGSVGPEDHRDETTLLRMQSSSPSRANAPHYKGRWHDLDGFGS